jgi:hypothetical protein
MLPARKRLPSDSPRKIQTDMTSFTGKRSDNKNTPNRSYAQVASGNRFEPLSDEEKDEVMEDTFSSASSEATPKQGNAQTKDTNESGRKATVPNPLSKKSQRKLAKATRKESHTKITNKYLSSATRATLEQSRRAKEILLNNTNTPEEESSEVSNVSSQRDGNNELQVEHKDKELNDNTQNKETALEDPPRESTAPSVSQTSQSTVEVVSNDTPQVKTKSTSGIANPYARSKKTSQGILHALPQRSPMMQPSKSTGSADKAILLKQGALRPHIH